MCSLLLSSALTPLVETRAGAQAQGSSGEPDMSANGRAVVFETSKMLVAADRDNNLDVYLRDTATGRTSLISRTATGQSGNDTSGSPSISNDGRFVAFDSWASDLVPGDTNRQRDVFLFDRSNGSMRRISAKGSTQGNGPSWYPDVAGNGSKVVFQTEATNLIAGDTNGRRDVAIWTRSTGALAQVNVTSTGRQANGSSWMRPSISNDGSRIAFFSDAPNLGTPTGGETVQVRDTNAGKTYRVATCRGASDPNTFCSFGYELSLSGDGRRLAISTVTEGSPTVEEYWRVVGVPGGSVFQSGGGVNADVQGLTVNRDGTAYAIAVGGLKVRNALGSWEKPNLGGSTAMSADGLRVAAMSRDVAQDGGVYLWDTTTGSVTEVDVP